MLACRLVSGLLERVGGRKGRHRKAPLGETGNHGIWTQVELDILRGTQAPAVTISGAFTEVVLHAAHRRAHRDERSDDEAGLTGFTRAIGDRVQIVGDDFLVTSADRIRDAARAGACNAALIKPNQAGAMTETLAAVEAARAVGWGAILSARSGETEDVTIVHLAVGWGVKQLKVGSFARSERMAKWNEGLRIEEALGTRAGFAGAEVLKP